MAIERFANNAVTTLSSDIGAGDLTLTVASATAFPTTGQFRILIETEILLVTGVAGNVFTVLRGQESTTAAGHLTGRTVTSILTAGAMEQFKLDIPQSMVTYLSIVSGRQYATETVYSLVGALPPMDYATLGRGTVGHLFNAILNIPASSTAQIRLYDVTNHTTLWESAVIAGPQTEYVISEVITPASGSSQLELWLATPTNTGGDASVLSAGILSEYT